MFGHLVVDLVLDLINREFINSSKEASVKEVQDMAIRVFAKTTPADAENKRKQANKEFSSNTNVSPLGRFLLSRFVRLIIL